MLQMQFTRRYCSAHRFLGTASEQCRTPHGHNWFVRITVIADEPVALDADRNMLGEFKKTKTEWHRFVDERIDHSFQLNGKDPLIDWFRTHEPARLDHILTTPGDPTTEMLAVLWQCKAQTILSTAGTGLLVSEVHLEETPTNSVSVIGAHAYREHLPATLPDGRPPWWMRADSSINDFDAR
jgi:6-pyruvoyltetrahydropterin/6-carboxytetrahydropterin synthase